ncbi:MAG: hypothetical protein MJ252_27355 [archaeon]|nr:hypothetical protein [archaeon]
MSTKPRTFNPKAPHPAPHENNYSNHTTAHRKPSTYTQKTQPNEDLSESRIIKKNLVYVVGLSSSIADKDLLAKYEYFGQYGKILKIVVNKAKAYNQNNPYGPSYSAYVTYQLPQEASIAILSLDESQVDNHNIKASFGTTKYCSFFLKGIECANKDCLYLHKKADESEIIQRGDLIANKNIFAEQHLYAMKIADIYNEEVKKKIFAAAKSKKPTIFPSPEVIYTHSFIIQNDPNFHKSHSIGKQNYYENNIYKRGIQNISNNPNNGYYYNNSNQYSNYQPNSTQNSNTHSNSNVSNSLGKGNNSKNNTTSPNPKIPFPNSCRNMHAPHGQYINYNPYNTGYGPKRNYYDDPNYYQGEYFNNLNKSGEDNTSPKEGTEGEMNPLGYYVNRETSRFDFGNRKEQNDQKINVPSYIQFLINRKINLIRLTKYINKETHLENFLQKEFLEEEKSKDKTSELEKEEWIRFLKRMEVNENNTQNNKKTKNNFQMKVDEYTKDFDKINSFIIDKCVYSKPKGGTSI